MKTCRINLLSSGLITCSLRSQTKCQDVQSSAGSENDDLQQLERVSWSSPDIAWLQRDRNAVKAGPLFHHDNARLPYFSMHKANNTHCSGDLHPFVESLISA